MQPGSKTCSNVNATKEENNYKQSSSGTSCSDQATERTAAPQGSGSEQAARGDTAPYSQQEYADGVGPSAGGNPEALWLGCARAQQNA